VGFLPRPCHDVVELILGQSALPEAFANGFEDLVERLVGQEVALDKETQVFRRRLARLPGALLNRAKLGGPQAASVVKYLESLGDADLPLKNEPIGAEDRAQLDGRYTFGDRPRDNFTVTTTPQGPAIERVGAPFSRGILHVGDLAFYPVGAHQVRIRFEREGAKIVALAIHDPDLVVRARKL